MGKAALTASKSMMANITATKDPVIRYTLLVKLLRASIEYGYHLGASNVTDDRNRMEELIEDGEVQLAAAPDDQRQRWQRIHRKRKETLVMYNEIIDMGTTLHADILKYMDAFEEWVAQPYYSPDHPGNFMRQTQESFEGGVHRQEAKKEKASSSADE